MRGGPTPIFGIPDLDTAIAPVLSPGWLGLVEGEAGTGLHLLAKQAAHASAGSLPTLFFTTHESGTDVRRVFDEFGWESDGITIVDLGHEFYDAMLSRELAVSRARARGLTLSEATVEPTGGVPPSPPSFADRLLIELAPMTGPFRLVLDSFDLALEHLSPEGAIALARQLRHQAAVAGGGALLTLQPAVPDARTRALVEEIADFVLQLRMVEEGNSYRPRLSLSKLRDHPERTRILQGSVTPKGFHAQF